MNCKNCQHWTPNRHPERHGHWEYPTPMSPGIPPTIVIVGECAHPALICENTECTPSNGLRADSGYDCSDASITVGAEFGCIHFQARQTIEDE